MSRLEEIEARARAATPGPWSARTGNGQTGPGAGALMRVLDQRPIVRPFGWYRGRDSRDSLDTVVAVVPSDAWQDEAFIAHARSDVPWLLAEVAWLRGELRDTIHEHWCGTDVCECRPLSDRHHDDTETP